MTLTEIGVDWRRKRLYPLEPKESAKSAKAMSVGVGIVPIQENSLVLAADTKFTSHLTYSGEKIFPLKPRPNFRVVVAAAGNDADFMTMAKDKIDEALPHAPRPFTLAQISSLLERESKSIYRTHALPLVKAKVDAYDIPECAFLFAIWYAPNKLRLLKSYKGLTSRVNEYDFIGSGAIVAKSYKNLGESRVDEFESGLLAAYWVRRAKLGDPYCGGKTTLYALSETGELSRALPIYLKCADQHFDEIEKLFAFIAIPSYADREMFESVLNQNLGGQQSEINHVRETLRRMYACGACYERIWQPSPT